MAFTVTLLLLGCVIILYFYDLAFKVFANDVCKNPVYKFSPEKHTTSKNSWHEAALAIHLIVDFQPFWYRVLSGSNLSDHSYHHITMDTQLIC